MSWNEGNLSSEASPLWRQIADRLRRSIASGEFRPGDVLPSETEINATFQVSRATARASLERLRQEGLIRRQSGRGSIVLAPKVEQPVNELASFSEDMRRRGLRPSYSTFSTENAPTTGEAAEALGVGDGALAFHIRRLLLADDEPIGMSESWLAPWIFAAGRQPTPEELDAGSLYAWLTTILRADNRRRKRVYRGRSGRCDDVAQARSRARIGSSGCPPPLARGRRASRRIRDHALPGRPVSLHHRARWKQRSSTDAMTVLSKPDGAPSAKPQVLPPKSNALERLFRLRKPVIGVIHLAPLPGAPRYDGQKMSEIYAAAEADAKTLSEGGVDGIIVENASDMPFARPEHIGPSTVAALTAACLAVRAIVPNPIGITCVANGVIPALGVAKAVGAGWVRANQWVNAYVANEGFLNGPAPEAMRYRSNIRAVDVAVFADVHVKFGAHAITADRSIAEQATDAEWFDADVLIASGTRTGSPTEPREVAEVRAGTNLPVIIGSGLTADLVPSLFPTADGAIVGQWLKRDGRWWNAVDPRRVDQLMKAVAKFRDGP